MLKEQSLSKKKNRMEIITAKLGLFGQAIAKVTPPCLMLMVQGNVFAITLDHWMTAFKTAGLVGLVLVVLSFSVRTKEIRDNAYSMAGLVAIVTAIVDFNIHASHYSGVTTEALLTGLCAGLLWLAVSFTPLGKLGQGND